MVSAATVKSHVNHLFAKIGARDRAQAVAYAYRTSWSRPRPRTEATLPSRQRPWQAVAAARGPCAWRIRLGAVVPEA